MNHTPKVQLSFRSAAKYSLDSYAISVVLLLLFAPFSLGKNETEITVAVATNFLTTAQELAEKFAEDEEINVNVVSGSSGKLLAQIKNGAPYDLFLSADQKRVDAVVEAELGDAESRITYALGRLCFMFSPKKEFEKSAKHTMEQGEFKRVVTANPAVAPYGLATDEVFEELDLNESESFFKRVIRADNIGQAFAMLHTGQVDVGMVALSSIVSKNIEADRYYIIPIELYTPIKQDGIVLTGSKHSKTANRFLVYLTEPDSKSIIRNHGYLLD